MSYSFYVRIDGFDKVWSNTPQTFASGAYTESVSLVRNALDLPEEKIENWSGIQEVGLTTFEFEFDSFWRQALNKNKYFGNVCSLASDLDIDATTAVVDSSGSFPATGTLHIGQETMTYSGSTASSFLNLSRGVLGTIPAPHYASFKSYELGSGCLVADRPLSLVNRRIELWMNDGTSTIIFDNNSKCLFSGFIQNVVVDYASKKVQIAASNMYQLFERDIANAIPEATFFPGLVAIDAFSKNANFVADGTTYTAEITAGTFGTFTEGAIDFSEIANQLNRSNASGSWGISTNKLYLNAENKVVLEMYANSVIDSATLLSNGNASLWSELGFTFEDGEGPVATLDVVSARTTITFIAQNELPLYRQLANTKRPYIYLVDSDGDFGDDIDLDSNGNYFRINDTIFKWSTKAVANSDESIFKFTIDEIGCFNSSKEAAVIAIGEDYECKRGFGIETEWNKAILYACCAGFAGGGYNVGYTGFGAGIPSIFFDTASFLAIDNAEAAAFYFEQKTPLREIVEPILALNQYYIHWDRNQFVLKPIEPAVVATWVLDQDDIISAETEYNNSEDNIVNKLVFEDIGLNQATEDDGWNFTAYDGVSVGTFGVKQEKTINLRWLANYSDDDILNISSRFFGNWAYPFHTITLTVNKFLAYEYQLGDTVSLTSTKILNPHTFADGVSGLIGTIYTIQFGNDYIAKISILIDSVDGTTQTYYSPNLKIVSKTTYTATIDNDYFSADDLSHFAVGHKCRIYNEGTNTAVYADITNISGSVVTFDSSLASLAVPAIVESKLYNSTSDSQKVHSFMADSSSPYTLAGDTPKHFR